MIDLILLGTLLTFIATGVLSPFVLSLGYVWADVMVPNRIGYSILAAIPISLVLGAGAFGSYLLLDRRSRPPITLLQSLCVVMAVWITLTTTWAVAPEAAWLKWDPSVKLVAFVAFMPLVFRSRVQIEAFVLVFLVSVSAHMMPWGVKTLITGGGYNLSLGLLYSNDYVLAESSSVAAVAAALVPLWLWVRGNSLIVPWPLVRTILASVMIPLYLIAAVGTFARTGMIAVAVMAGGLILGTRRKILFLFLSTVLALIMFSVTSDRWAARMGTIETYDQDNSAYGRVLVWKWTLGFVQTHPLGGGFRSFLVDRIEYPDGSVAYSRAFHNSYVAVLGEHGYPGLVLFLAILVLSLLAFRKTIRLARTLPELTWAANLARAGLIGLLVMLASTNFVDLSFLFIIWDFVALAMCLEGYVRQVTRDASNAANASPIAFGTGMQPAYRATAAPRQTL